jgi:L-ascorbate metabolism protein UlaG (beta-lactamase superfamily)
MKITYFGQSCFLVETQSTTLLFDPFISANPLAKDLPVDDIQAEYILLTHGHYDHVLDAEKIAKRCNATIISNFEIAKWYEAHGCKTLPMNHGGVIEVDFGTVKFVNAVHSSVLPDGTYGGSAGGFVLYNTEACFYIAGDTALTLDMQLIPLTCPPLDFAILPIGDTFTMGFKDATIAADFVNVQTVIGCHYDTFKPIIVDHAAAIEHFGAHGKKLVLPEIGKQVIV